MAGGKIPVGRAKRMSYFYSFSQNLSIHSLKMHAFREKSSFFNSEWVFLNFINIIYNKIKNI